MPNTKTPSLHVMTSTSSGGLELYVSTLIAEMARAGMPVSALVAKNARFINTLIEAGVDVHFAHSQNKLDLRDVLLIRSIVRSRQCGIIHSHTRFDVWRVSLALIGDRARKHVHSVYMVVVPKKDWLHRMIYGRVDAALSSSSYTNARIAECFNVAAEKIHLVRYGRYLGNYQRDEALRNSMRTEFGLDANALAFGMICRIVFAAACRSSETRPLFYHRRADSYEARSVGQASLRTARCGIARMDHEVFESDWYCRASPYSSISERDRPVLWNARLPCACELCRNVFALGD
jgi:hypothetical protein